jgi:hypothetical protein
VGLERRERENKFKYFLFSLLPSAINGGGAAAADHHYSTDLVCDLYRTNAKEEAVSRLIERNKHV